MSQMATRKSALVDEKEKRTDSPVKDMKKKLAANAEKEKATDKKEDKNPDKTDKIDKKLDKTDKNPDKSDKKVDKSDKNPDKSDKNPDKTDKNDKTADKADKHVDKVQKATPIIVLEKNGQASKSEKVADKNAAVKNDKAAEKPQAAKSEKAGDKTAASKSEKAAEKPDNKQDKKADTVEKGEKTAKGTTKPEQAQHTPRKSDKPHQNGKAELNGNGTENGTADSCDETSCDEFPELAYDESDTEPPTPDRLSRSLTRRSQVKPMRTPETPQPNTEKPTSEENQGEPKDKVLKLNETPSERKLRSTDSPKPQENKAEKDSLKKPEKETEDKDVEMIETHEESRKPDTNFSKSRVKVSPYRRSVRLADQTNSSTMANYTGNNTTMEMDIESSLLSEEPSLNESSYLNGLRDIKGRRSYKPLKEMTFNRSINRSTLSNVTLTSPTLRPTGAVVGRKRKPDAPPVEVATEAASAVAVETNAAPHKRVRLLEKISMPFRRVVPGRTADLEGEGINTDVEDHVTSLASCAPVKPADVIPVNVNASAAGDAKRCAIM